MTSSLDMKRPWLLELERLCVKRVQLPGLTTAESERFPALQELATLRRITLSGRSDAFGLVPIEAREGVCVVIAGNQAGKKRAQSEIVAEIDAAGAEILAFYRTCDCATKTGIDVFLTCDPCKDSLPDGLWMKFVGSPLKQRKDAGKEVEKILKRWAQLRELKAENRGSIDGAA
jgi:hypothetical protein